MGCATPRREEHDLSAHVLREHLWGTSLSIREIGGRKLMEENEKQ